MKNDFSSGKISSHIIAQAIPLTLAQLVQLMYNVVDRIYMGHLPGASSLALTGIGLVFPLTSLIGAFTNLFGTGGAPLFAIARGAKKEKRAEEILGNTFTMILICSALLLAVCYTLKKPILYLFGASDSSFVYADAYLKIYLIGTPFVMLSTGLNGFINAQGFPKTGMMTTIIGAVLNLLLDPLFIFGFNMGVTGAAAATVISQIVSAVWVLKFLTGKKVPLHIKAEYMRINLPLAKRIISLGCAGFIMRATNSLVQVTYNSTLKTFGGDLYVGIMTVINSVSEILSLPVSGIISGSQPVISFNYGAREFKRVKQGIKFTAALGMAYTAAAWLFILAAPRFLISIFTNDSSMLKLGVPALHMYFFGFVFMSFQFTGQSTFTALGYSKQAIFFSLFRKAIIVAPLAIILPRMGLGVKGVFMAEPISNIVGGLASFLTMWFTVYIKLGKTSDRQPLKS